MRKPSSKALELPEVNFSEDGESRYLHLGTPWIQGSMKIKEPEFVFLTAFMTLGFMDHLKSLGVTKCYEKPIEIA